MKIHSIARTLWLFCLIVLHTTLFWHPSTSASDRKQKVLILHSYHQGLEWTDNITAGINEIFKNYHDRYELCYEYLDTKRNFGLDYSGKLIQYLKAKKQAVPYNVIIVSDNNALNFIKDNRESLYPGIPIVFCGINNFSDALILGMDQITGVVEKTDYEKTIEIMKKIHPEKRKVLVILDRTPTGNAIYQEMKRAESKFLDQFQFNYYRDFVIDDLEHDIKALPNDYLIYILAFNRDKNGHFISYEEAIEMLSKYTKIPIYGSWDFYFGKGIVGGAITSGVTQGKEAGQMALDILRGKSIKELPIVTDSPTNILFDYTQLKKKRIALNTLPEYDDIINKPLDFYEKNRAHIIKAFVFLTLLVLGMILFLLDQIRKKRMLKKMNADLFKMVETRTAEIAKKNDALEKLATTDRLTKIYNRRKLDEIIHQEYARAKRFNGVFSIIIADLDDFKSVNDTYGHCVGDKVLTGVADILKNGTRQTDYVGRWGGEEFMMVCCETSAENAVRLAEKMRHAIEAHRFPLCGCQTASFGVAAYEAGMTREEVVIRADKALYVAKDKGKNRVDLSI